MIATRALPNMKAEKVPLKAMLRRASRMAENMFDRDGEDCGSTDEHTGAGRKWAALPQ